MERQSLLWLVWVGFLVLIFTTEQGSATLCSSMNCTSLGSVCQVVNGTGLCVCPDVCYTMYAPVCASDGKTYGNDCLMRAHACKTQQNLTIVKRGECDSSATCGVGKCGYGSVCQVVNGTLACRCSEACHEMYAPVCASDGKTYGNDCLMRAHACKTQLNLTIVKRGECETIILALSFGIGGFIIIALIIGIICYFMKCKGRSRPPGIHRLQEVPTQSQEKV